MVEKLRPRDPAGPSEFERTPGWLDSLLEQPMRIEAALLRAGARLPAGLSVLGVFRS